MTKLTTIGIIALVVTISVGLSLAIKRIEAKQNKPRHVTCWSNGIKVFEADGRDFDWLGEAIRFENIATHQSVTVTTGLGCTIERR